MTEFVQVTECTTQSCRLQAKKDPTQRSLDSRLRNARYFGELVKFRLAPFGTVFVMLKVSHLHPVLLALLHRLFGKL